MWKMVAIFNAEMGRKQKAKVEPPCSADKINVEFLKKVERIRAPLLAEAAPDIADAGTARLTGFASISEADVLLALKGARSTWSTGIDEVSMAMSGSW